MPRQNTGVRVARKRAQRHRIVRLHRKLVYKWSTMGTSDVVVAVAAMLHDILLSRMLSLLVSHTPTASSWSGLPDGMKKTSRVLYGAVGGLQNAGGFCSASPEVATSMSQNRSVTGLQVST